MDVGTESRQGARLTGERPQLGVTPDSLLALHAAGYRAVVERLGPGRLLDVGCGQGFESIGLTALDREVVGVDYSADAVATAAAQFGDAGLRVARMDALELGLAPASFDWVCSSHLIEHFVQPELHVAETARVLKDDGAAFFLTPNEPADFENPFHVHLFGRTELADVLGRHFEDVWIGGVDATASVKADFAARRRRANRLLALDVLDVRHRIPRGWYVAAYTRLLPLAYRLVARSDTGGATGITADDWYVTEHPDDTTLVLLAIGRRPRRDVLRADQRHGQAGRGHGRAQQRGAAPRGS
ncbi:MAG: class I SAM-dependent methyltransferase [Actinomycetota bacterium]|nr:class I SAM-dependent methyltransferase [Actinomycetota bacterium]